MSAPKSLAGYPEWFFTIVERAMKQGYKEDLPMDSKGACINLRQRFYKFRQLLIEAGHPHAAGALSLTLTIHGQTLRFSQLGGLSEEAAAKLGVDVSGMALPRSDAADRVEVSDPAEELLNEMLGLPKKGRAPEANSIPDASAPHTHEYNVYDVCVICNRPKEEA